MDSDKGSTEPTEIAGSQAPEPGQNQNQGQNQNLKGLPAWALRLGKLMIVFAILGCILLATGAFLIGKVLDNALAPHGF